MKAVIICAICDKPKKFSESYAVKITDYRDRAYKIGTDEGVTTINIRKARACRSCTKKMGYKVKSKIAA